MSNNFEILQEWYHRVWGQEDVAAIDEMMAHETVIIGFEEQNLIGREDFKLFHSMVLALMGQFRVVVDQYMTDGEWVAARLSIHAMSRCDSRKVDVVSHVMIQFRDQKIIRAHNLIDFFGVFTQLGLLPERALDRCLLGQRLGFAG